MKRYQRKRKKKNEGVNLLLVVIAAAAYYVTESVEGTIAVVVAIFTTFISLVLIKKYSDKKRLKVARMDEVDAMDGVQFEHYLSVLFKSLKYSAKVTQSAGDYGADLIIKKDGRTIAVQAKRYKNNVGIKSVQEIIPALKVYDAQEAWVVTNSYFTKPAKELAEKNDVKLIDRDQLIKWMNIIQAAERPNPEKIKREIKQEIKKKCDKCNAPMVIRNGKSGIFYGCTNFPHCKNTAIAK